MTEQHPRAAEFLSALKSKGTTPLYVYGVSEHQAFFSMTERPIDGTVMVDGGLLWPERG